VLNNLQNPNSTWLVDTGFIIALAAPRDHYHTKALRLAQWIEHNQITLLVTEAVILEVGAALSKTEYRREAAQLMESLYDDEDIQIIACTPELMRRAIALFKQRLDKDWSLCDCVSFVTMADYGMSHALAADHHFEQAGFTALLLSTDLVYPLARSHKAPCASLAQGALFYEA
jgi:predicted nucleic acid-binding protein